MTIDFSRFMTLDWSDRPGFYDRVLSPAEKLEAKRVKRVVPRTDQMKSPKNGHRRGL